MCCCIPCKPALQPSGFNVCVAMAVSPLLSSCMQVTTSYFLCVHIWSHLCFYSRAVGNKMYGSQYHDQILDTLRKSAEHCDCLQSFFIIHSMGGGE